MARHVLMSPGMPSKSLLFLSLVTTLAACNRREDTDVAIAETAVDSATVGNAEGSLLAASLEGATNTVAPAAIEDVAAMIAAAAGQRFQPAGCAVGTSSGNTVTIAYTGCTGPRGLRAVDGTLTLSLRVGAGGAIVADASATDFQIGDAVLDIASTATYTPGNLAVSTTSQGVGPLGRSFEHVGDYTVAWTSTCVTVDGAWSTSTGDVARSTTADVMRCIDECPTGSISRTTIRGRVITIELDGTDTARWTSSGGGSGSFPLACGL